MRGFNLFMFCELFMFNIWGIYINKMYNGLKVRKFLI